MEPRGDSRSRRGAHVRDSTLNGHPRFFGYITSSAAPIGALADMLAAAVNSNCGAWGLSPMATEIERQSVRWIAELIGYSPQAGGLLVSGGNVANMVCLIAAIRAQSGMGRSGRGVGDPHRLRVYASSEVHTWLQKGADICGLGTDSFVRSTSTMRRDELDALARAIAEDRANGDASGGRRWHGGLGEHRRDRSADGDRRAVRAESLWFHVDGAYGAPAAMLRDAPAELRAIGLADSVAVDPHKWLYAPLEAGCALVRNREQLHDAFVFHPPYYRFDGDAEDPPTNFTSGGRRTREASARSRCGARFARSVARVTCKMIGDDIELAREMHRLASASQELEALTQSLSITTFGTCPATCAATQPPRTVSEYAQQGAARRAFRAREACMSRTP